MQNIVIYCRSGVKQVCERVFRVWEPKSRSNAPWLWNDGPKTSRTAALKWIILLYLAFWGPSLVVAFYAGFTKSKSDHIYYMMDHSWRILTVAQRCVGDVLLSGVTYAALFTRQRRRCCSWAWFTLSVLLLPARIFFIILKPESTGRYAASSAALLIETGLLLLACIVLVAPVAARAVRPQRNVGMSFGVSGAAGIAISLGSILVQSSSRLPWSNSNYWVDWSSSTAFKVYAIITDVTAGPTEEVFFCLLLVVLLRHAGSRWKTVGFVCVGLRFLFHIYYGTADVSLMIWAVLTLVIYATTGRWIAIAVMHSIHDICAQMKCDDTSAILISLLVFFVYEAMNRSKSSPRSVPSAGSTARKPQTAHADGAAGEGQGD